MTKTSYFKFYGKSDRHKLLTIQSNLVQGLSILWPSSSVRVQQRDRPHLVLFLSALILRDCAIQIVRVPRGQWISDVHVTHR